MPPAPSTQRLPLSSFSPELKPLLPENAASMPSPTEIHTSAWNWGCAKNGWLPPQPQIAGPN